MNLKTATDYALPIGTHATLAVAAANVGIMSTGVSATPLQAAGAIGLPAILSALLALWQWWRNRKEPAAVATFADVETAFQSLCDEVKAQRAASDALEQQMRDARTLIHGKTTEAQP